MQLLVRVLRNGTEAKLLVNAVLERCNGGGERLAEEDCALLLSLVVDTLY